MSQCHDRRYLSQRHNRRLRLSYYLDLQLLYILYAALYDAIRASPYSAVASREMGLHITAPA